MKIARDPAALRAAITEAGRTIRGLAAEIGVNDKTLRLILGGGRTTPARATQIARRLGRTVDELFMRSVDTTEQQSASLRVSA